MKFSLRSTLTTTGFCLGLLTLISAQNDCYQEKGNYYCDSVQAIAYSNFGTSGSYDRVTSMNDGTCGSTEQAYGGGMAPLDKEVSWHFRGPMHIKQFAYYTLGGEGTKTKRDTTAENDNVKHGYPRRHAHQRFHDKYERDAPESQGELDVEKRAYGDAVTATINGQVVTMTDTWSAQSAAPAPAAPAGGNRVDNFGTSPNQNGGSINTDNNPGTPPAPQINAGAGNWGRQAYFNAATANATGLVFLNNKGGDSCSGTFDYSFGNSLSYASSDGKRCSPTPQILTDGFVGDGDEIALFTDAPCDRGSCGFVRPKSIGYHGFSGQSKMFLMEFDMPLTGSSGFNRDMPATWILNAEVPRAVQYASPSSGCSCWTSGCGEWDVFEVLDSSNLKVKSTWHGKNSYGDSNWFTRPTGKSQKTMVLMDGDTGTGTIVYLDDSVEFGEVLAVSTIDGYVSAVGNVVQARLPG